MITSGYMGLIVPVQVTDSRLISSNVNESDYLTWSSATIYGLGDRRRVDSIDAHYVYESIQGDNTNHEPNGGPLDTWWILVSATNKRLMFDSSLSSQTVFPNVIDITIRPNTSVDSIALLNINATKVIITVTDPIDGVIYNKTISVVSLDGVASWYDYFYEPIVRSDSVTVTDIPPYATADIRIQIIATGEIAACGACIIGVALEIGSTEYGAKVGIQDYSQKTQDVFGNYSITKRAFNKYADITVRVDSLIIDRLQSILAQYRATPIVYVGSDILDALIIYGFYSDFSIIVDMPTAAICNLSIKGLT